VAARTHKYTALQEIACATTLPSSGAQIDAVHHSFRRRAPIGHSANQQIAAAADTD